MRSRVNEEISFRPYYILNENTKGVSKKIKNVTIQQMVCVNKKIKLDKINKF